MTKAFMSLSFQKCVRYTINCISKNANDRTGVFPCYLTCSVLKAGFSLQTSIPSIDDRIMQSNLYLKMAFQLISRVELQCFSLKIFIYLSTSFLCLLSVSKF